MALLNLFAKKKQFKFQFILKDERGGIESGITMYQVIAENQEAAIQIVLERTGAKTFPIDSYYVKMLEVERKENRGLPML